VYKKNQNPRWLKGSFPGDNNKAPTIKNKQGPGPKDPVNLVSTNGGARPVSGVPRPGPQRNHTSQTQAAAWATNAPRAVVKWELVVKRVLKWPPEKKTRNGKKHTQPIHEPKNGLREMAGKTVKQTILQGKQSHPHNCQKIGHPKHRSGTLGWTPLSPPQVQKSPPTRKGVGPRTSTQAQDPIRCEGGEPRLSKTSKTTQGKMGGTPLGLCL